MPQREIKFRAWDKFMETMIENLNPYELGTILTKWKEDSHILQQYTGLKDKNRKEIYEGDITDWGNSVVKFGEFEFEVGGDYKNYNTTAYGWYLQNKLGIEELTWDGQVKVIGNIYENPELLCRKAN